MVAAISSRTRPADSTTDPAMKPNKRIKHSHDQRPNGLALEKSLQNGADGMVARMLERFEAKDKKYNESRAVVKSGVVNGDIDMADAKPDVVEISSDESSEEDSEDDDEDDDDDDGKQNEEQETGKMKAKKARRWKDEQVAVGIQKKRDYEARRKAQEEEDEEDDDAAPTFGEILAREYPTEAIDVEAAFADEEAPNQLVPTQGAQLTTRINAGTLTTVLSQALKTNDREMFENCLSLNDVDAIRSTIEKLPSTQIATLLLRLSEKLYRRPGRAGLLMIWVQWSLVSHGGYLTSQPEVMNMLAKLKAVINERAGALLPLQGLKGRLDMLTAQLTLRKNMQTQVQRSKAGGDHEAVIYVEGEDESSLDEDVDSDESDDDDVGKTSKPLSKRAQKRHLDLMDSGEPETSGDEADLVNGVESDDGSIEEGGSEEENDELIDDEAEDTDDDDGDEEDSEDVFDDELGERGAEDLSEEEDTADHIPLKRSSAVQSRKSGFSRR